MNLWSHQFSKLATQKIEGFILTLSEVTGSKICWACSNFLCQTKNWFTYCSSFKLFVPDQKMIASSFYRSKYFEPAQKFDCIYCLFKNFCSGIKTNFTECKSSFCLAQNDCDCHNMKINFWSGTKNLDQPKTFWDL